MAKRMTLTFRPGDDMLARLKAYCADRELRPSQVVRLAIKEHLNRMTGAKLARKTTS